MNHDMWTIEDADPKWNFLIRVEEDGAALDELKKMKEGQ